MMPDGNALAQLYPQPQAPQPGLMTGDPSRMIGMVGQMQQIQGRNAMGEAWRNALQPDGSIDHETLMKGAANAGWMAPDAVTAALSQKQQTIQNQLSLFEQGNKRHSFLTNEFASLAGKDNISDEDIHNLRARLARNVDKEALPSGMINEFARDLLGTKDPKARQMKFRQLQATMAGPQGASTEEGPPGVGATPTKTRLQSNIYRGDYSMAPPGAAEATAGYYASGARLATDLTTSANEIPQRVAALANAENALRDFTPGPGRDYSRVAKAFVNANVPLPESLKFDEKSIAQQEGFNKWMENLNQLKFRALGGTGTEAHLQSVAKTSPNEAMSKGGVSKLLKYGIAAEYAIQAKAREWDRWQKMHGKETFNEFNNAWNRNFDLRAFEFRHALSKEDQQNYIKNMSSPEDREHLQGALKRIQAGKWIDY